MGALIRGALAAAMVAAVPALAGPQGGGTTGTGGAGTGETGIRKESTMPPEGAQRKMRGVQFDERGLFERIHADNLREITLGQLTLQRAKTEGAKRTAEMIIRDHQKADQQLSAIAKEKGFALRAPTPISEEERKHKQLQDATLELLRSVDPSEYDSVYLSHMVSEHDHDLALVSRAQQQFTGKTRTLLEGLAPVFQQHRDQAFRALGEVKVLEISPGVGGAGGEEPMQMPQHQQMPPRQEQPQHR